jgi:hypothetical protein
MIVTTAIDGCVGIYYNSVKPHGLAVDSIPTES